MKIELTERQALLCERAFEAINSAGAWTEFENDINEFSGEKLTEIEMDELIRALRSGV